MSIFIILWGYLAGVLLLALYAARRLGQSLEKWEEEAEAEAKEYWSHNPSRVKDRSDSNFFSALGGFIVAWVFICLLWPVSLPFIAATKSGMKTATTKSQLQQQLKDAEIEIERIRHEEGWVAEK